VGQALAAIGAQDSATEFQKPFFDDKEEDDRAIGSAKHRVSAPAGPPERLLTRKKQQQRNERTTDMKNKGHQPLPGENHPNQDEVARRAYELYQARGGERGHELEDWLQAEREVNKHGQFTRSG
jgi:hypothetical protein